MPDAPATRCSTAPEELANDLIALCEALRVLCAAGDSADLGLADIEPVALLAVQVAKRLARCVLGVDEPAPTC